ncbi:hypothetical protein N9878_00775 [bacterium]|nr:hypothetical protein [bacterium]
MKPRKSLAAIKGLVVSWKDSAKDLDKAEVFDHKTSHKNPIYRLMSAEIFNRSHKMIVSERRLFWLIDVSVVFNYPDGTEQRSSGDFESWCTFGEVAPHCVQIHSEGLREGNQEYYSHTEFTATCLKVA